MEQLRKNIRAYYGIIPVYILENRILLAHCKIAYAWLTSVVDSNNISSFPLQALGEVFDVDVDTTKRWLDLLVREKHILVEYKTENEKEICFVELLFPQRPAVHQEKENNQDIKKAAEPVISPAVETPEQILSKNYNLDEIQKAYPDLAIRSFEVPLWSLKILEKYGKRNPYLKNPKALHDHFITWIKKSKYTSASSDDLLDVL